ncbi:hypothetical protein RHSIM_Rhsim04G0136800 [Rhododendron simsii]|uniref:Uncharacterized protein n=1 Tax=Rhododendron simsii TaxID=118357 RepID=A0A834GXX7_RHOSS|nr:hypothetical protein RHSIM_Rhsim04G0136800 [Rhododendron simsii]
MRRGRGEGALREAKEAEDDDGYYNVPVRTFDQIHDVGNCGLGLEPYSTSINKAVKEIKNGQEGQRFVRYVSFFTLDKVV